MEATTPAYPTRLSDTQWETLAAYFAADSQLGRPRNTHLPAVVEAILYVLSAGSGACCRGSFRLGRPSLATFHPGATRAVGSAFTATYAGGVRLSRKRQQSPWVAIADTQSVPLGCLTHRAGDVDGGKRVKGRKRHLLVESMGLLLAVVVTAAKISDQQGLPPLWRPLQFQGGWFHRLGLIWGDRGYGGHMLFEWVLEHFHCMLEVLEHPRGHGFRWVSRRWVVERTLAWISRCRRLSQDDEKLTPTSETFIYLAMITLMLKRLA